MAKNVRQITYSMYTLDEMDNIISIDSNFTKLTGYKKSDISELKLNQNDLIFPEDREEYFNTVAKLLFTSGEAYIEHRLRRKDGIGIYVFCLGYVDHDEAGREIRKIRAIDMSDSLSILYETKKVTNKYDKKMKKLVAEATTDSLTTLLRRDAFQAKVDSFIENKIPSTFIMIDVDDFKGINDKYGHLTGDRILKDVAKIFKDKTKDNAIACRFGGDEFALFLINKTNREDIEDYLNDLQKQVSKIRIRDDKDFRLTLSIGASILDSKNAVDKFKTMYRETDELLYFSKNNGKNQYTIKN